jgi:DNA-binding beta-propeller fold protein YncE
MKRVPRIVFSIVLILALSPDKAPAASPRAAGLSLPDSAAFFTLGGKSAVAVLEALDRRVVTCRVEGDRIGGWTTLPGLESPAAIASDETGLLLVVDRGTKNYVLKKFQDGRLDGKSVELAVPVKRTVVGAAARNGILWLLLQNRPGVVLAAYDGDTLAESPDISDLCRSPFSVALDAAGRGYVTDPMGPTVLIFTAAGKIEGRRDLTGTGFTRPSGVAVDAAGAVWVSDGVTGRVAELAVDGAGESRGLRRMDRAERFDDPLRLLADPKGVLGVWVVESRVGRLTKLEGIEK